jgi:hypothetical protein
VAEGVAVEVGVRLGEEFSVPLAGDAGSGLLTTDRKLPTKMADATTTPSMTASTAIIRPSLRLRDGGGGTAFAGSLGVELLAGLLAEPGQRGSSVVKLDHLAPSQ